MSAAISDPRKRKQFIILAVLGVVFGYVLFSQVMKRSNPAVQATQTGAQGPAGAAGQATQAESRVESVFQKVDVDLDQLVQEIKVVEFEYAKEELDRDPTLPLVGDSMMLRGRTAVALGEQDPDDLLFAAQRKKVTGIIWDSATPFAVIDNDVVGIGFTFEDTVFVKAIERDHVVLGITGQDIDVVCELKEQ